ncbi:Uncharacterised protein [Kluyvera cryocrescens]|uniref:Uncharacterized protein n=1 Tax=Kluyvera cryocrescens TaxID=580 RepID=A0A485CWV0_KLUCR|nr:Uncharacterised protein [Kluyvera cryocrescens]
MKMFLSLGGPLSQNDLTAMYQLNMLFQLIPFIFDFVFKTGFLGSQCMPEQWQG